MTPLVIGDPKKLKKGQWVLAIGSPFGLDSTVVRHRQRHRPRYRRYLPFIQTDVAVNPGNSGGPLINLDGEAVGINSQIISRSGGFMGISLAIPIDEAMRVVDQLRATGKTRGRVGVQIGEVGKDVAEAIGLPKAEGALVSSVEADGPADKAGVQPGDVILKFNGETIKRWSDLPRIVGETKPGTSADLEVWRKARRSRCRSRSVKSRPRRAAAPEGRGASPDVTNALGLGVVDVPAEVQRKLRIKGGVQVKIAEGGGQGRIAGRRHRVGSERHRRHRRQAVRRAGRQAGQGARGGPAGPSRRADAVGGGARVQIGPRPAKMPGCRKRGAWRPLVCPGPAAPGRISSAVRIPAAVSSARR